MKKLIFILSFLICISANSEIFKRANYLVFEKEHNMSQTVEFTNNLLNIKSGWGNNKFLVKKENGKFWAYKDKEKFFQIVIDNNKLILIDVDTEEKFIFIKGNL